MTQIETIILHSIARHEGEAARRQQDDCYAPTFDVWVDIKGEFDAAIQHLIEQGYIEELYIWGNEYGFRLKNRDNGHDNDKSGNV